MFEPVELFPEVPNLYEFPSVHAGMLFDEERVGKYSEAIRRVIKKGDVVADIGTGTGLLAFLCLEAGAARVHAIERSAAVRWAKLLAEKNGFTDRIIFHNQDSRFHDLPEKVNVVVSELIGHIAFEEGMAESLFDAKERFLVPDGVIIPEMVQLRVALVEEDEIYPKCIECWHPIIHGIDYSLLREEAVKACYVTALSDRNLLSEPVTFFTVDFCKDKKPMLRGTKTFSVLRFGLVNGISLWFDALLAPEIRLSSGPWTRTHWKQCFAPIATPIAVNAGDKISVEIDMQLQTKEHNSFNFNFSIKRRV
ncbi:50S ribosomal protein L11 methyltransferase [bacterium]|nr:50S ribosomal protein L11 methyltransferase [bacterium]